MTQENDRMKRFAGLRFDVEHALSMYAFSYVTLPGFGLYDKEFIADQMSVIEKCHIYMIGYAPKVAISDVSLRDAKAEVTLSLLGRTYRIQYDVPEDFVLHQTMEEYFLEDSAGRKYVIDQDDALRRLRDQERTEYWVKYVGQAYGRDGSRNALDRLMNHETLQKIALKPVPEGYSLQLVLIEVKPANQLITMFNPMAMDKSQSDERINAGLDKLFHTSEQERIALYEAAMIRYFMPEFNREFKDSFPSTNLKILQDCYDKDFSAVVAEFYFDDFPYLMRSEKVQPKLSHAAEHHLHDEPTRKAFFAI